MRVLVTGGLGLVGRSVVAELLEAGHSVRLFDTPAAGPIRRLLSSLAGARRTLVRDAVAGIGRGVSGARRRGSLEVVRGDLCNVAHVGEAVCGVDAVIHLGALIPPAADRNPTYASYVNEGGTANIINALERNTPGARLVYTSSIAIYGDRRANPLIRVTDPVRPGPSDHYAMQKAAAEAAVKRSSLDWVVLRLSYIVSPEKLQMDPLMFEMPLDTSIEVCTVRDTARALVAAIDAKAAVGHVFNIAGGATCRTNFREYLRRMLDLFGLDASRLPDAAFSTSDFHCGFMDTNDSQAVLRFQNDSIEDYYEAVGRTVRLRRVLLRALPFVRRLVIRAIVARSPHIAARGRATLGAKARLVASMISHGRSTSHSG